MNVIFAKVVTFIKEENGAYEPFMCMTFSPNCEVVW